MMEELDHVSHCSFCIYLVPIHKVRDIQEHMPIYEKALSDLCCTCKTLRESHLVLSQYIREQFVEEYRPNSYI